MGSACGPVLHCNFESCKIHEFLAFNWSGHGVKRESDLEGYGVGTDYAKRLRLGFGGYGVGSGYAKRLGLGFGGYGVGSQVSRPLSEEFSLCDAAKGMVAPRRYGSP